jgi:hypothetical protein
MTKAATNMPEYTFPGVEPKTKRFLINCVGRATLGLMFQVHATTIDRWVRDHGLPTVTVDGVRLFHLPDVREWATGPKLKRCYDTTPLAERMGQVV